MFIYIYITGFYFYFILVCCYSTGSRVRILWDCMKAKNTGEMFEMYVLFWSSDVILDNIGHSFETSGGFFLFYKLTLLAKSYLVIMIILACVQACSKYQFVDCPFHNKYATFMIMILKCDMQSRVRTHTHTHSHTEKTSVFRQIKCNLNWNYTFPNK